jgi:molecular chaperone DnaJ/curved DNA-binding protein
MSIPSPEDYYALLGVTAAADGEALRRAWRALAARWHPDRAGVGATAKFQQIAAAYAVLSDPLARLAYDRSRRASSPPGAAAPSPAPPPAAPARPTAPAVMLSRLCRPIASLLATGAARYDEPGFVTLVFRRAEAAQGGMISIPMPVQLWCPECVRNRPAATCPRCAGRRVVDALYSAWLAVPPGVGAGEVLTPSVDLPGMVEAVRFRVELGTA